MREPQSSRRHLNVKKEHFRTGKTNLGNHAACLGNPRDQAEREPRGVVLKGSCSFELRKEAEQRQGVQPGLNVESDALNLSLISDL